ncbi:MAG: FHA domain-containing protein [Oligoflexia bacterium]|nr:FHA domain-containing protein [Oligoflexia bacterium]
MNISVSKNHQVISTIDLKKEVEGSKGPLSFFIGRGDDCHVQLDDMQISREHAKITFNDNAWTLEKLSEFKEMSVNGSTAQSVVLKNGDTIAIGPFLLTTEIEIIETNDDEDPEGFEHLESEQTEESPELSGAPTDDDLEDLESSDSELEDFDETDDDSLDSELADDDETELLADDDAEASEQLGEELGDSETEAFDDGFDGDDEFASDGDDSETEAFDDGFDGDDEFASDESYDDEYNEDSYDLDAIDDDDGSTKVIQAFAKIELNLSGEFAPYDKFTVEDGEYTIGRDPEKCNVVLADPEVSGTHAKIKKTKISCTIEDLQSGNGTLVNGERVNSHELHNGDEIVIGSTTFSVVIASDFLQQEQDRLMPVEENQVVEVEEIVEVDTNFDDDMVEFDGEEGDGFGEKTAAAGPQSLMDKIKDPKNRIKVIIGAVLLVFLLLPAEEEGNKNKGKQDDKKKSRVLGGDKKDDKKVTGKDKKPLTPEQIEEVEQNYLLGKELYDRGDYAGAMFELEKIFRLTDTYKNSREIYEFSKEGLANLERIKKKEQEEKEKRELQLRVKELVKKADGAVKERRVEYAESLFAEIMKLDPENFDVPKLKQDLEAYKREQERIAVEKAQKKAERDRQLNGLKPGEKFYIAKEWYKAINKLEEYLKDNNLDEDLRTKATKMLTESRTNLSNIVDPLVGKARSLKEGQDLKTAYETYKEIMKYDPNNIEAIEEMNKINDTLTLRSKKVYREAIIAESLSLFDDAKEKFQEVQQISPTDSEYYKKATEKLKNFLE